MFYANPRRDRQQLPARRGHSSTPTGAQCCVRGLLKEEVRRRQNKEVIYKGKLHGFVLKLTSDRNCLGNISAMYQPNLDFIGAK